ncbi:MAG: hypothetical protein OSJ71_03765 [Acetatifactor sp.]|nr:hypothetical protein [Acetatifactor sp.]
MELWALYNENRDLTGKTHFCGQEVLMLECIGGSAIAGEGV